MAALDTTSVVIPRVYRPTTVQRFLSTSERYLFNLDSAVESRQPQQHQWRTQARTAQ